jgi:ADP-ribose pyrophosphatase
LVRDIHWEPDVEEWIRRETVFDGSIFRVESGAVRLDDGTETKRDVIVHPGAVAMVPVHDDHVVFVRQYRIAVGRDMLEIPAGKLEPGDTPESRAQVELAEEIGYVADRLVPAGRVYPSVGFLDECQHMFLAFDLREESREADGEERLEVVHLSLDEVRQRLHAYEFEDAKTVIGLKTLLGYLER